MRRGAKCISHILIVAEDFVNVSVEGINTGWFFGLGSVFNYTRLLTCISADLGET